MRVIKDLNNISSELKKKIKPLGRKDIAIYQIKKYNVVEDPDTHVKTTYYYRDTMWLKDTIWDAYAEGGARFVDIGIPERINKGEVELFKSVVFDNASAGTIYLRGDNIAEVEIDEFWQLCNYNENTLLGEDRDKNVELAICRIDRTKEAREKNIKRNARASALNFFGLMDSKDKKEFAASMNWNYNVPAEELDDRIGEYIEDFPEEFTKAIESTDTKRKATIKYAIEERVIEYDANGHKIKWPNGETIASLERVEGKNHIDLFNDWLATSLNGDKILSQLKRKAKAETV